MLSVMQIEKYRAQLLELSLLPIPEGCGRHDAERCMIAQWREFVPDKAIGRQLCESFTDEELIAILKEAATRLGRAPVQGDIFCFYRTYIKHRFVTWSAGLKAAGLSSVLDFSIGGLAPEEYKKIEGEEAEIRCLIIRLMERWTELGYPPARKEFPGSEVLKRRFESWSRVLNIAMGYDSWLLSQTESDAISHSAEVEAMLQELREKAEWLGRTPLKQEIPEETRCRLRICFGTWNAVLKKADLALLENDELLKAEWDFQQRRRGNGDVYHIADLEPEYWQMLEEIKELAGKLGRAPLKDEADELKRKKLQERCGSWRNALYQVGLASLTRHQASIVKKKKRDILNRK